MALSRIGRVGTVSYQRLQTALNFSFARYRCVCQKHISTVKSLNEIPGPKGLPIIGTALDYYRNDGLSRFHEIDLQRKETYGPIYREKIGMFDSVVIFDPDDVERVFRHEGKYPRREPPIPFWNKYKEEKQQKEGVFSLQGEEWYRHRHSLNKKILQPKIVEEYADRLNSVVTDFMSAIARLQDKSGTISKLYDELFKWALESIGTILFERRFGNFSSSPPEEAQRFVHAVKIFNGIFMALFIQPPWLDKIYRTKSVQIFYDVMDVIYGFGETCIQEKLETIRRRKGTAKNKDENEDLLTFLLTDEKLDLKEVTANVIEMLLAGVDTTSNAMIWTLYSIAKNPEVQENLYHEVSTVLGPKEIATPETLRKMHYIKACVKESLRLYPVATVNSRFTAEDLVLSGYLVPAGTFVRMGLYAISRDPKNFDDPLQYKPERWLRNDNQHVAYDAFASLPFGFGLRSCLGRRIVELEMYLLLSRFSQTYKMESLNDVQGKLRGVLVPDRDVVMKLKNRL